MREKTFCPYCGSKLAINANRAVTLSTLAKRETTWHEIAEQIEVGNALELFSIGDEISETLTTGEEVVFVVSGINVYKDNEAIFTLKDCLALTEQMNDTYTNVGGWAASKLRDKLNTEIFNTLSPDLKAVISPRMIDGEANALWPLSIREIFDSTNWNNAIDSGNTQLPYYKRKGNRLKGLGKNGPTHWWWTRFPLANDDSSVYITDRNGEYNEANARGFGGLCFGFCI